MYRIYRIVSIIGIIKKCLSITNILGYRFFPYNKGSEGNIQTF